MMSINLNTLLSILAVLVIPAIFAWQSLLIKVAKLEARADAKDEHLERIENKIDKLIDEK